MKIKNSLAFAGAVAGLLAGAIGCSQPTLSYIDESPPEKVPAIFAPGTVSTEGEFEFGAVFSNDHGEFYYGVFKNGKAETRVMKFEDGKWTSPQPFLIHEEYSYNDPFLTPDQNKLFFISDQPLDGKGPKKDYDLWYVERQADSWSKPINAGPAINSTKNEYYISFTSKGKIYFSSNRADSANSNNYDIYSAEFRDGKFQTPVRLGSAVNSGDYEADVFVAPDESYLIFSRNSPEGLGIGDLYISFRNNDGSWTTARSLGATINTETDDFCPFVTQDGKYLFYASRGDVYWVESKALGIGN